MAGYREGHWFGHHVSVAATVAEGKSTVGFWAMLAQKFTAGD